MSEMVEKVARALCAYCSGPDVIDPCPPWAQISDVERDEWRGEARAAIAAMREPTAAMVERGNAAIYKHIAYLPAEHAWQEMIDAAT